MLQSGDIDRARKIVEESASVPAAERLQALREAAACAGVDLMELLRQMREAATPGESPADTFMRLRKSI